MIFPDISVIDLLVAPLSSNHVYAFAVGAA